MNLHIRARLTHGYTPIVQGPTEGIKLLRFGILRLRPGERHTFEALPDRETGIVILSGNADVVANGLRWENLGQRASVFEGRAAAVYLPPRVGYSIEANSELEAAVVTAPAEKGAQPTVIRPEDVVVHERRGKPGFMRDVHDIVGSQVPAEHLLLGETFNHPGEWSSYPPHKHDVQNPPEEVALEEIYFYKIDPPQGFGLQRIYSPEKGLDVAYVLENNDTVLIPFGYHPVVGAPGYALYYLWFLAGEGRDMRPRNDPVHEWVLGVED